MTQDDTTKHATPAVGCAGWSLPRSHAGAFPDAGTHLERYARRLPVVEINSSFHRPHQPATYARWAASVPPEFRFSVKVPKAITHSMRLVLEGDALSKFLAEAGYLSDRLSWLLVQLPPSLAFDPEVAERFFAELRDRSAVSIACEPRHATWFESEAERLLVRYQVARVAADPARVPAAGEPGGWPDHVYYRLHGSPRMYYSAYEDDYLASLAQRLQAHSRAGQQAWCIFDNTTLGAATGNALELLTKLRAASKEAG